MILSKAIEESFARYAGNVILDRAICDVRDMFKPAARMLLYSQYKITKNTPNKPFIKSARVVGDALGSVYTHGDSSCYSTYIRMAKPFAMRYPIEDCQGNSGTIISTSDAAAMRYTELRLSKLSEYLFNGLDKSNIEWKNNFDETMLIPSTFTSIGFYNIVNGTTGIGVALSSSIPQFNLRETNQAIIKLIQNPNIPFNEIYCAPDFATGGIIMNAEEVYHSLEKGEGKAIRLRSKMNYDSKSHSIHITEIPYGVYTETLYKELSDLVNSNENYGIEGIDDTSNIKADITIKLSKNANPDIIMKKLYKDTSLESFYTINMTMLENGRFPKVFGWRQALQAYIDHIRICRKNELQFDVNSLESRNHILNGLLTALANIDDVVKIIKNSKTVEEARNNLMKIYNLDEAQTKAILDMKLQRLANLEAIKVESELNNNLSEINRLNNILGSQVEIDKTLIDALQEVSNRFGDSRRTQVVNEKDLDVEETEVYLINENNILSVSTKGLVKNAFKTTNLSMICIVTSDNHLYKFAVSQVIDAQNSRKKNFDIKKELNIDSDIVFLGTLQEIINSKYWLIITKDGYLKKMPIKEHSYNKNYIKNFCKLKTNDNIIDCTITDNDNMIFKNRNIVLIKECSKNSLGVKING